jgi:predicted transcriptional regulator
MNLSTKQYYSRISGLVDVGLIKRHEGKYSLTLLGKVVYYAHMTIGKTLAYYWKLKAIESIHFWHSKRGENTANQPSDRQSLY